MLSELLSTEIARLSTLGRLPRHRQLYEALRRAILDGRITATERLPSSRELSQDLAFSRNTVMTAISQLTVEGYLVSHVGSGTFVANQVARRPAPMLPPGKGWQGSGLSARGRQLAGSARAADLEVQPFSSGIADFSAFPLALWQRLQNKHWRMAYPDMLDYSDSGGYAPLRRALANYLRVFRSVPLQAEQVIITSGTQQSLSLCAHLLADHGSTVWLEDPAYWGATKVFMAAGLRIHPVAVDQEGIAPTAADELTPPRLMYVTPSHQYPTGEVMSLARRHLVLELARTHQAWVLEDDYDSEFRFSGPPISSLTGLDSDERVLYMGSFSKVLYPGLKLGYLIVPPSLVAEFRQAHYDLNRPGQLPLQAALAEFIEMGHFASALRRARQSYAERRRSLLAALQPCLGPMARITGAAQGLHLCLRLASDVDDRALAMQLAQVGLTVRPLSAYCLHRQDARGLIIGYGYTPLADIERCGPLLARTLMAALAQGQKASRKR
jgi:GntR family transcriptional regulator/MocR family aminotransferase